MDEQEIRRIVKEYSNMIKRISYSYLEHSHDCEDICQTVFVKLLTYNISFNSKDYEKAWIIRTTINACHDLRKSAFFKKTVGLDEIGDAYVSDTEPSAVLEEIGKLPGNYRAAIYLHYYEGYTTEEIADMMGKRKTAVSKYLTRGRKILKVSLADGYLQRDEEGEAYGK